MVWLFSFAEHRININKSYVSLVESISKYYFYYFGVCEKVWNALLKINS